VSNWRPLRPLVAVLTGLYAARRSMAGGPGHRGAPSDHFDGRVFRNTTGGAGKSFADFSRWQRTRRPKPWPQWVENRARPSLPATLAPGATALTFVNHITFLVQFAGLNVLTDPVYSERVSPFRSAGPRRVRAPGLPFEALPRIDLVLVSHNHYDHLDLDTLRRLAATHAPRFITGLGNAAFLRDHGVRDVVELDWWQSTGQRDALVTFTPAQHWSGRGLRGRNRTLWGGLMLRHGATQLYFAGDTGYGAHFAAIRRRLGPIDLALLPIGAYEPRWFMQEQHMDPDDAVRAHLDLGARVSVATHFGCFQLTDEGIDDPVRELALAREQRAVPAESFQVFEVGETRMFASGSRERSASVRRDAAAWAAG
jgi:L-ascorbate metabolism protein UlaG (beta-lactamase superfamily)